MSESVLTLPDEVVEWIESSVGASVVATSRVPGGATREAWFVDLDAPAQGTDTRELFLRYSPAPLPDGSAFHRLQTEAEIMVALARAGARVPHVLAAHPTREAVLSERVPGATWFYRIQDPDEQVRVAQDFIRQLAFVHRLTPDELDIPTLGPVKTTREHALERIDAIRTRGTAPDGTIDPLLRVTVDWLEANVPDDDGPVVLVQGDTGPGNFMYDDGHVTAVVDWELAHWGDPMDDIAWLSLRTVQDTFTHFPDRLREYEELSGIPIDEDRVWYYRVFAEATMVTLRPVGPVSAPSGGPVGRDIGNGLIYGQLHRRLWLEALSVVTKSDASVPEIHDTDDLRDWHGRYDDILGVLQVIVPRIDDPLASQWTKGVARAVKYLKEADRNGRAFDALEHAELTALLGDAPADLRAARAAAAEAVSRGDAPVDDYVRVLWNKMQRDEHLMRTASGALHDRTWPPLR